MELLKYREVKALGKQKIIKMSDEMIALNVPRFDPQTGESLPPQVETFTVKQIENTLSDLNAQIETLEKGRDSLREFLNDVKAALAK